MRFKRVVGQGFRNFNRFTFEPSSKVNVIFGENGSGKTSLLESIYLFGFGRSFRPGGFRPLIKESSESYTLFAEGVSDLHSDRPSKFGMQRSLKGQQELRINGSKDVRLAELAKQIPVQLFTPESVEVIVGGPAHRRQLLDWGVFHVEHSFFNLWSSYNKVLKHRNSLLKQRKGNVGKEDDYWVSQLALFGENITSLRASYVDKLSKYILRIAHYFLPNVTIELSLKVGWDQSKRLEEALADSKATDTKYGHTSVGPHKADLNIVADGVSAKERLSRGQLKVLMASMMLAQTELVRELTGESCIVIVDDLTSELDSSNQKKFCELLEESGNQVFITAVEKADLIQNFKKEPELFHVEHGLLQYYNEN